MHEVRDIKAFGRWRKVHVKARKGEWAWWRWFFPGADMDTVYIALGRTIFCPPNTVRISDDMYVHELVHLQQQKFSYLRAFVTFWRFWLSKKFRLDCELPAFQAQYHYMKDIKSMSVMQLYQYRHAVADVLSSKLYGEIISKAEAFEKLGEKA